MDLTKKYFSKNEEETKQIAFSFSGLLSSETVVYLIGEVGSGKTTFAKSVGKYFGITDLVSSSYSQVSSYKGKINLIHCDFYRRSCDAATEIEPLLQKPWLLIMEWPKERLIYNENKTFFVNILKVGKNTREFVIERIN